MARPSFRFFIIPLGAICTLASLSAQNATPAPSATRFDAGAPAGGRLQHEEPDRGLRDPLNMIF